MTREVRGETITRYLYDANGNLTKKDDGTNVHAYKYDVRNLMTDYDSPGANNDTTYRYDAAGRRITKNVNGTKTAYVHDGLNTVAEYNESNQLQRTYVTPGLDQNLSLTASGSTYYYLSDALGSIRQVLDADQDTENSYDYEAFGCAYGSPTENLTQPFRFTGRDWDTESTLYYYRARNYSAALGRFVARDPRPSWATTHLYQYVANQPLDYLDPSGLEMKPIKDDKGKVVGTVDTDWVNCIGYATGQEGALYTIPPDRKGKGGSSLKQLFEALGYKCLAGVSAKDCPKVCCCKDYLMLYVYIIDPEHADMVRKQHTGKDPYVDPIATPDQGLDVHGLRGTESGYEYQPYGARKGSEWDKTSHPRRFLPTDDDPDRFKPQELLAKYCCCKKQPKKGGTEEGGRSTAKRPQSGPP